MLRSSPHLIMGWEKCHPTPSITIKVLRLCLQLFQPAIVVIRTADRAVTYNYYMYSCSSWECLAVLGLLMRMDWYWVYSIARLNVVTFL